VTDTGGAGSGYRHLTFDERARGGSRRSADYSFEACLRDVAAVLDARGVDRPIMVGWSSGAYLGLFWADRHPDRVSAVVSVDGALPYGLTDDVHDQREGMVLARAVAPGFFAGYLTQLEHRLEDPEHVELQKRGWEASTSWDPDDPRLADLASALVENLLTRRELMEAQADFFTTPGALARYRMLNDHRADELPTLARLPGLVEARLRAAGLGVPNQ
jgi:pimeloyl-ACP methyl ester carboxylesterase